MKEVFLIFFTVIVLVLAIGIYVNKTAPKLGVNNGSLTPCPNRLNCVNSQSEDPRFAIPPLPYVSMDILEDAVLGLPRTILVKKEDHYLRVECRSKVFRFVDDVEFLIDPEQEVIHVRSASRVGWGDFGVNRKRIEQLRQKLYH